MKKSYWVAIAVGAGVVVLVAGIIDVFLGRRTSKIEPKVETQLVSLEKNMQNEIISTSNQEVKTSPNAIFIFKTYYKECEHITNEKVEIPKNFVNQTQEEIKKAYEGWRIEEFNSQQVVFYMEKQGICNEHYIIRENNGYVAIYSVDAFGKETLKETTEIVTAYLPETDKNRLKEGIKVNGKEELNAALEDYE